MAPQPSPPGALKKVQAILDTIGSPAYARNGRFDVVAWNDANTRMFGDFACMPENERNLIRLMFSRPYHRKAMVNWEQDARNLVAKFRLSYGQAATDVAFSSLVQDMMECSADFRRMWADHEVTDIGEGVYVYRTRRHGTVAFQHSTLMPEVLPDLRIVINLPVKSHGE